MSTNCTAENPTASSDKDNLAVEPETANNSEDIAPKSAPAQTQPDEAENHKSSDSSLKTVDEAMCNGHESQDSNMNSPSPSSGTGDSGRGRTFVGDTKSEASEGKKTPKAVCLCSLYSFRHLVRFTKESERKNNSTENKVSF